MAHIRIVCDASYDQDLWFSGYAGIVNIRKKSTDDQKSQEADIQTLTYQGVAAEHRKSQEGETLAVLAGLRQLAQRQLNESDSGLLGSTIDVYTDCKGTAERFYNFDPDHIPNHNDTEYGYIKEIYGLIERYDWRVKVSHVDAHVPNIQANVIQKLNNKVDERANDARLRAVHMMLHPHEGGVRSGRVAVLLPKVPMDISERNAWSRLAYHLAEKGKKIHLYTEGNPNNHPFLLALADFAVTQQVQLSAIVKPYTYMPDFLQNPLNKRELTIIRHHMKMRGLNTGVEFTNSEVHIRAAIASRLLFGEPAPSVMSTHFSDRKHPAVDVVYDLMNALKRDAHGLPNSVQGWLHTFLDYVDIPVEQGLHAAFTRENLKVEVSPETTFSVRNEATASFAPTESTDHVPYADADLLESFYEIYEANLPALRSRELTYNQLAKVFIHEYTEQGHSFPACAEKSIERFVYAAPKKEPKKFVNRVLKQIRKLSPQPSELDIEPVDKNRSESQAVLSRKR